MIVLKRFGDPWGRGDLSMFCAKVETYLQLTGTPYRAEVSDVRKAPKQKLPCLVDGDVEICDSRDILAYLEGRSDAPLDGDLSPPQRALSVAIRGLVEEALYFHVLYLRWQLDSGWAIYAPVIQNYGQQIGVPGFITPLIARQVRKDVIRALRGQGTGRHSPAEVEERACEVIDALSVLLGDQDFFLGDRLRTVDATVYPTLDGVMHSPFEGGLQQHALAKDNLRAYVDRVRARCEAAAAPAQG